MKLILLENGLKQELNLQNTHSNLDAVYAEGLDAFWNRKCYKAIEKMNGVLALYQGHPYAQDYIDECNRAILAGEDEGVRAEDSGVDEEAGEAEEYKEENYSHDDRSW